MAEAQVSLNGVTTNIFGNNTNWQTYTVSFTATQSSTPLQIQGIEPGMLLDAASVTSVQTNYNYLVFTENTNLTTTPIKFAAPPFTGNSTGNTNGISILLGPLVDPENNHRYYLLDTNTWTASEAWQSSWVGIWRQSEMPTKTVRSDRSFRLWRHRSFHVDRFVRSQ